MAQNTKNSDKAVLHSVIDLLSPLEPDARRRVIRTVLTYFDENPAVGTASPHRDLSQETHRAAPGAGMKFVGNTDVSAKEFLLEKQPRSDIERVACLAFYLTHYRDTPHFKTIDISKLNTEAAQLKFSNTAKAVNNAATRGFLAPAGKGNKQISALGEQFVAALPNRDAVRQALDKFAPRRRSTRSAKSGRARK